jgi:hexokinase
MKLGKLLLAVVGAAALLSALASSASARNLSFSSQTTTSLYRRLDFSGGIGGTIECEVKLSGSFHSRTHTKTTELLIGYITEGTVLRCARGSATINQASFPWHRRYHDFGGTLPNVTSIGEVISGVEWNYREPAGITCTVTGGTSLRTFLINLHQLFKDDITGLSRCGAFFTGTISGEESNLTNGSGARVTITLI